MKKDMTEQELLDLKREVEEAKENHARLEGKRDTLMEQLEKEFGVKSIEEAEEKIQQMETEVEEWDEKILSATNDLEDLLNGNQDTATKEPTRATKRTTPADPGRSDRPQRRTPR